MERLTTDDREIAVEMLKIQLYVGYKTNMTLLVNAEKYLHFVF